MTTTMSLSVQEILQCNICQETMTDPKMLHCQHSFCSQCLEKWHKSNDNQGPVTRKLSCPTCRSVTKLPAGGVGHLKSDLTQKKLADVLTEPQNPVCEVCIGSVTVPTQGRVSHFCSDCNTHMCTTCAEAHKNIKLFSKHSLLAIVEKGFCQQHTLKRKNFYCEECDMLVCMLCVIHFHQTHQDSLYDARKYSEDNAANVKELKIQLNKGNQLPNDLKDIGKDHVHSLKKINENITRLQEQVLKLADSAMNYIEVQRQEIHSSLQRARDAVTKWQTWSEGLDTLKPQVEELLQKCNTYLQTGQPTHFPHGYKDLNEKVQAGIKKYSMKIPTLEPHQLPREFLQYEEYLSKCKKVFAVGPLDNSTYIARVRESNLSHMEYDRKFWFGSFYDEYVIVHDDDDDPKAMGKA